MAGRSDRAQRLVAAPAARIWRAMTDPAELVRWLPPAGMAARLEWFDLRPGGGYRMTLTYLDPTGAPGKSGDDSDTVEVRFVEVVPFRRIVQAAVFEAEDARFAGEMRLTWELAEVAGGTSVTITADDVPPGISAEDHQSGLRASLENLAAFVS